MDILKDFVQQTLTVIIVNI